MEMLKKLKKKIVPLVLAVVIFATSVVSGPASLTAQAASVVVSTETSVEFVMMLYNIFETISIASGMKEGLDDYSKGMSIFEAFIQFIDGLTYDPFKEFTIYGPDGTAMTREEFDAIWESAVGAGKLKVKPNEGEFAKYRVLTGGLTPTPSPDPSASPSPSPIPGPGHGTDLNPNIPKRAIGAFAMGTDMQFQKAVADFLNRVQNHEVPEVDPAKYYDGLLSSDFNYYCNTISDHTGSWPSRYANYYTYTGSTKELCYVYDLSDTRTIVSGCTGLSCDQVKVYLLYVTSDNSTDNKQEYFYIDGHFDQYDGSKLYRVNNVNHQQLACYSVFYPDITGDYINVDSLDTDMKIFNSLESFRSYCKSGDVTGQLNSVPYDYHSMTAAAPDTLENLSGMKLDPAKVPAMNNAMKEAANGVKATGTDKEANNAEMIAAVKAAVAEALAEAQPDPAPEPTAAPDPEPSAAPDPGTDTNYFGILGLILSAIKAIASGIWDFFCDPMGAITTGLTNLYNGVLRIIEIFPEQVQLVLGNIASLPSAMLQVFADPLGAIQSLLGALPSWANLQAYLDKILQALLDPVSALQPSGPGGSDPGGDDESGKHTPDLLSLLNGLILLIMILLMLLRIFLHCLQFIVGIFKIEASPGFLPDDMVLGLNYLKTLEITGIGMSVYDFMMGLIYIFMVFGVIKLLRGFAFHIHIPKGGNR